MPHYVVDRLRNALEARGRTLRGARVLLLGLAYKPGVPDTRESPAVEIFRLLDERRAEVSYHDPLVPRFPVTRRLGGGAPDLESQPLTPALLSAQDAVLVVTPQPGIDFDLVRSHAPLVVDTRGVYRDAAVRLEPLQVEMPGDFPSAPAPAYHRVIQA
jgi:UDP-N-acetyl-D-glucosamine dehydrogenase